MRVESLRIPTILILASLASTILAKRDSRSGRLNNFKYKNFAYPARASAQDLQDNQVDLGYEIHEGKWVNDTFLAFRNIPYAEPPADGLRWYEPIEPQTIREKVNEGLVDHKCPQIQVGWVPFAQDFLNDFGEGVLPWKWRQEIKPEGYGPMPDPIDGVDEDCLTLDVMVPKTVWEKKDSASAAVIVWIYGGGFVYGWKDLLGSPAGLFEVAESNSEHDGNIIYVAMNYRLGAFGWLGGPKFQADGGLPNLGLHDQRFAMKWVQRYIERFGGDPTRVTVMGQSAGASSILHHLTAGGGRREYKPNFDKAIVQSAGFFPQPDSIHDDRIYEKYLELTGAKDLNDLQTKDTKVLQDANAKMTFDSPYGIFNFGPTVDGDYVPDLPGKLLGAPEKSYHQGISLLAGHMAYDGLLFTPPWIRSPAQLREHSWKLYPGIPETVLQYIDENYPIKTSSVILAQKKLANVSDFLDDIAIQCNSYYLTEAFLSSYYPAPVFRYSFNTLPAIHGYDTGYTYYPSPSLIGPADEGLAKFFQKSIVNFARFGDPDPEIEANWPLYTADTRQIMNLGEPGQTEQDFSHKPGPDLLDREKCAYWQSAPYYVSPGSKDAKFVGEEAIYKEGLKRN